MKQSKVVEGEINEIRNISISVKFRSCIIYFDITDMAKINPMYQYSLAYSLLFLIKYLIYSDILADASYL